MPCWDMEKKGKCRRGEKGKCKWCDGASDEGYVPKEKPKKKKTEVKKTNTKQAMMMQMMQMIMGKTPKGAAEGGKKKAMKKQKESIYCEAMKENGTCPLGDDCPKCQKMKEKFGTNDPNDMTCWDFKMKGKCRKGDKCKYTH
eukprot:gnl/MRDRNA2_/MRDRNA2_92915_c0_seq1.p2 gnl/MRDRNA2_/MRDRNA2_92915_c0~~gnl/MRDRNA2_/MRDRNA2_92915_c0_seq1.p2  ORF type:complete len:142 (+),score=47.02 gnl/MRDRNA2_/MRDRNA2_92915_c0_seq1:120-545(+)